MSQIAKISPEQASSAVLSPAPAPHQGMILVVESERRALTALRRQISRLGYDVVTAASGEAALNALHARPFDLVIVGERVSDTDGATLCHTLKTLNQTLYLPLIRIAGNLPATNGLAAVPDITFTAPPPDEEFATWIRTLIGVRRQVDLRFEQLAHQTQTINALKSDIIDNVSHELSTPLLQVKSAVALLVEDITRRKQREQYRIAEMATQAVARLEGAITNIRQLARTHNMQFTAVVLHEATDLAIRQIERSWTSRGARDRIEIRLPPDLPPVLSDKRVLGHLFQLLLDNALKFSPADSPVQVIADVLDEGRVWVGVRDFGIGIPPEEHSRIFEPFYQVDGSSTRRYGGTGTGLSLAMLLATGLGTTILLDSAPGEGSTFSCVLPVADLDAVC